MNTKKLIKSLYMTTEELELLRMIKNKITSDNEYAFICTTDYTSHMMHNA